MMPPVRGRMQFSLIWLVLACYGAARVLQVVTGPAPTLWLVALDVLSAIAFAVVHGARHYGWRGIGVFCGICLVVGNAVENVGIATGLPFGHYRFLDVMGPKVFSVPILLGLAYVGMAYVSWTIAGILLPSAGRRADAVRVVTLPLLASLIMVAWDVAQDPVWSTFLHAWEWRDGGGWFGVPVSNFLGWYITVLSIYVVFALYLRGKHVERAEASSAWSAVVFYGLCAGGNMLQMLVAQPVSMAYDASGASWRVADILRASALVSLVVMGSFAALSAVRLRRQARG